MPATINGIITVLRNGQTYGVRVRTLTGAEWAAWSDAVSVVPAPPAPSIVITGSRESRTVTVEGVTTGLVGRVVTPWVRFPCPSGYTPGDAVRVADADGSFTWQRIAAKKTYVYFRAGEIRSNRFIVSGL